MSTLTETILHIMFTSHPVPGRVIYKQDVIASNGYVKGHNLCKGGMCVVPAGFLGSRRVPLIA